MVATLCEVLLLIVVCQRVTVRVRVVARPWCHFVVCCCYAVILLPACWSRGGAIVESIFVVCCWCALSDVVGSVSV